MSMEKPTYVDFLCATHVLNALRKAYGSADLEDIMNEDEMRDYGNCVAIIGAYKDGLEMARRAKKAGR